MPRVTTLSLRMPQAGWGQTLPSSHPMHLPSRVALCRNRSDLRRGKLIDRIAVVGTRSSQQPCVLGAGYSLIQDTYA